MTTIERHREEFVARKRVGERLLVENLSHDDLEIVYAQFRDNHRLARAETSLEQCQIYCDVLASFGVMCPHPIAFRRYSDGTSFPVSVAFAESRWYECAACGCAVINR